MRRNDALIIFSATFLVLFLDRITKYIICAKLVPGQSIKIFPDIFHITLVLNKGAAFGMLQGGTLLFIALSTLIIFFILFYTLRNSLDGFALKLAVGLILGGAIGNMIDRIRFGCVIDFLDFRVWPVFNIADSALTVGTIVLALKILFKKAHGPKPMAQS